MLFFHEERKYNSDIPVEAKIFNDINFLAHWHNEIELLLVIDGSLKMMINSESRVLEKDDMAICTSGDIHSYDSRGKESKIILLVFRPEFIEDAVKLPWSTRFTPPFIDRSVIESSGLEQPILKEIKDCFETIHNELNIQKKHFEIFIKSRLIQLIGLFLRYVPPPNYEQQNGIKSGSAIKMIQKAIKFIQSNYSKNISLEDVSEYLKVTPSYFSSSFNKKTGQTFKSYLNTIRVEKADILLKSTKEPVIDIAYECGFNSIRTFNRVFKNIKGVKPSRLRSEGRHI